MRWLLLSSLLAACTQTTASDIGTPIDGGIILLDAGNQNLTPCERSDDDGDGFGDDPSCPTIDCDDQNIGVFPGAFEACNGIDEDCDGETDEELGEGTCGTGACRRTLPFCADGRPVSCTPAPPGTETCNGIDDDCDGEIDEELLGTTCGVGACLNQEVCAGGQWMPCEPAPPSTEVCNRIDDNCDGETDEGFGVAVIESSYSALRGLHPSCEGGAERIGPNCNAAFHRFCGTQGCSTSGFGPLENFNDVAVAGCVRSEGRDVPYSVLSTHHPNCEGNVERIGPNCNAAMHRYCTSEGFVSGFGPAEQGMDSALVQCLTADVATLIVSSYSVLSTHHDGCNSTTRIGPACNAAISRFCASQGHSTGFGPVENSGDISAVVCVSN